MAIVTSIIAKTVAKDGRDWVLEQHTDHAGTVHENWYRALVGYDGNANLAAHAAQINVRLRNAEIAANMESVTTEGMNATVTLNSSTVAQNAAALRAVYQVATRTQAIMIGDYLNTLTNGQIANAFGITNGQAATLRTNKLEPAAALAASIRAATGA